MFVFLKSLSRSVHQEEPEPVLIKKNIVDEGECTSLTVWRKSLVISCNGFTVIDSNGNLVYRVDNYIGSCHDELVLMDGSGKSVFTMRRSKQKLTLVDSWHVFEGGVDEWCSSRRKKLSERPICYVKKHMMSIINSNVLAYVYYGGASSNKRYAYTVEGSYANRSCKVLDGSRRVLAEIKRKEEAIGGISFGVEVFLLMVHPGFDVAFAMALVLLLDHMFS